MRTFDSEKTKAFCHIQRKHKAAMWKDLTPSPRSHCELNYNIHKNIGKEKLIILKCLTQLLVKYKIIVTTKIKGGCKMSNAKEIKEIKEISSRLSTENKKYVIAVANALLFSQSQAVQSTPKQKHIE